MGMEFPDEPSDYGDTYWQDTIHLLKLVQSDYQDVRQQLERVNHSIAGREMLVSQRLEYALRLSGGYHTLCLTTSATINQANLMGKTVLGDTLRPHVPLNIISLNVRCLGRFEIRSEKRQIERWQSVKAKSLLAYLMAEPRVPVIKEVLMEALWPDCDAQSAGNSLKAAMYGLRQTLNRLFNTSGSFPYILFLQGSYLINPDIDLHLDIEDFEKYWNTGRHLEREDRLAEAIHEYESAEALYHGDYLQDEPYEEWTLLRREALKDTYIIILGKLADYAMETTDYESSIIYCQKILARDPCREDTYRRLMRCYSHMGQRNRALRWYEICHQSIHTELDTTPEQETTTLYHQLLRELQI
ncbi:BTAD domain-containing putative transcriptional regulator [Chloroflexota bacterium]